MAEATGVAVATGVADAWRLAGVPPVAPLPTLRGCPPRGAPPSPPARRLPRTDRSRRWPRDRCRSGQLPDRPGRFHALGRRRQPHVGHQARHLLGGRHERTRRDNDRERTAVAPASTVRLGRRASVGNPVRNGSSTNRQLSHAAPTAKATSTARSSSGGSASRAISGRTSACERQGRASRRSGRGTATATGPGGAPAGEPRVPRR